MVNIKNVWTSMNSRCKNASYSNSLSAYVGCSVCDEWEDYKNFEKWCFENLYNCNGEKLELDKDLLVKGNKIYSPNTCCFLPKRINVLITSRRAYKNGLPPGVTCPGTRSDTYIVNTKLGEQRIYKSFEDKNAAFNYFKQKKEAHIKSVASYYKNFLPDKIYNALITYEILITDSECNTYDNEFVKDGKPIYSSFTEYMKSKVTPETP